MSKNTVDIANDLLAEKAVLEARVKELEEYKEFYEEAMLASNEAGYAMISAAETIKLLASRADEAEAELARLKAQRFVVKLPQRYSCEGYHIDEAYLEPDNDGECFDREEVIEAIKAAGGEIAECNQAIIDARALGYQAQRFVVKRPRFFHTDQSTDLILGKQEKDWEEAIRAAGGEIAE